MKRLIPFLLFVGLISVSIFAGWLLNEFELNLIGKYLGIPGSILLIASLIYSISKKDINSAGKSRSVIKVHEILGALGSMMIIAHAGLDLNAIIPSAALFTLVLVIATGFTMNSILMDVRNRLLETEISFKQQGLRQREIQREMNMVAVENDRVKKWSTIHSAFSAILMALILLHVISTLLMWGWD